MPAAEVPQVQLTAAGVLVVMLATVAARVLSRPCGDSPEVADLKRRYRAAVRRRKAKRRIYGA
jgi:hypothetical protein